MSDTYNNTLARHRHLPSWRVAAADGGRVRRQPGWRGHIGGQHRAADGDGVGLGRADPINYGRWHMGMVSEFEEFIARGNVLDLAVAVVIGAAFGKIVTALVDGITMPVVGLAMGGADFCQLFVRSERRRYGKEVVITRNLRG